MARRPQPPAQDDWSGFGSTDAPVPKTISGGGGSSAISSWRYNTAEQRLSISFAKGGSHSYSGVPQSLIDAFQQTGSQGKFFNYFIRNSFD